MSTSLCSSDIITCSCCNGACYIREIVKQQVLDVFHPVNSLYISADSVNPSDLFGGVWERVSDGLLYSTTEDSEIGSYGGSKKITIDNLPSHNHTFTGDPITGSMSVRTYGTGANTIYSSSGCFKATAKAGGSMTYRLNRTSIAAENGDLLEFNATPAGTTESTGEGMDYLPYHFKVAVWRRTA